MTTKCYVIIFQSDLYASRVILAIAELIWAITLLLPEETISRPIYLTMFQGYFNEIQWSVVWFLSCIIQLYILHAGKFHTKSAVMFAGFNSILWWFATVSMYLSVSPASAAISGELALAISATWIWIRSGWITKEKQICLPR
jgi:hypothetical protein